jgi:hypothetical protein
MAEKIRLTGLYEKLIKSKANMINVGDGRIKVTVGDCSQIICMSGNITTKPLCIIYT